MLCLEYFAVEPPRPRGARYWGMFKGPRSGWGVETCKRASDALEHAAATSTDLWTCAALFKVHPWAVQQFWRVGLYFLECTGEVPHSLDVLYCAAAHARRQAFWRARSQRALQSRQRRSRKR